jgi:hypothetical protein
VCECHDKGFITRSVNEPNSKFQDIPSIFPLVSSGSMVGTAFVFKDHDSRSHVISWSNCEQPTCQMTVNGNIRSIPLQRVSDNDLLVGTLPEEMCNNVPKFEAAPLDIEGTGTTFYMASRCTICSCSRLIISRLSKICPVSVTKCQNAYVRKSWLFFGRIKSKPLGAPLVNCDGKLVGVVKEFKGNEVTVLTIDDLVRLVNEHRRT